MKWDPTDRHMNFEMHAVLELLDTEWSSRTCIEIVAKVGKHFKDHINASTWVDGGLTRVLSVYTIGKDGTPGGETYVSADRVTDLIKDLQMLSPASREAQHIQAQSQLDEWTAPESFDFWVGTEEQIALATSRAARLDVKNMWLPKMNVEDLDDLIRDIQEVKLLKATSST